MKYLKSLLIISVMFIMVLCLAGCEDGNTSNTNNSNKNTSNTSSSSSNNKTNTSNSNTQKSNNQENVDVMSLDFLANAEKQTANPEKGETIAIMHIKNYGDVKIKFFKDIAPKAVENFITHSKNGYYNGTTFHRVINDFMIQGGDPTATGRGGESIWGKPFVDEFSYYVLPYRGALCMANSGSNTNGSQFFIEQAKTDEQMYNMIKQGQDPESFKEAYKKYGGSMHLVGKHTVFGQVFEGMDVVDKIAATKTDENDKPVEDVVIESIEIKEY